MINKCNFNLNNVNITLNNLNYNVFFNNHLSFINLDNVILNTCYTKNKQIRILNNSLKTYLFSNYNSDLTFNFCKFNLTENEIVFIGHFNYYCQKFQTKLNNTKIDLKANKSKILDYIETQYNENKFIVQNCQVNRQIITDYKKIKITCHNTYLIDFNTNELLNTYGFLEENNNVFLNSKETLNSKYLLNTEVRDNIFIGNNFGNLNKGNNNIIITNQNGRSKDDNFSSQINNAFIIKSLQNDHCLITGNMQTNLVSINNNDYLESEFKKDYDLKLNVNGSIKASHYNNLIGTYTVKFKNFKDKKYAKDGMLLCIIDKFENDELLVELTKIENNPKVFGVYKIYNKDHLLSVGFENVLIINDTVANDTVANDSGDDDDDSDDNNDDHNINNIYIGDFITSSKILGYAKKQKNNMYMNYTIGKTLENINWNQIDTKIICNQVEYKYTLIKCKIY